MRYPMLLLCVVFGLTGCATTFSGPAKVENGRAGCEQKCRADGLEFEGMIHMGEYSTGCICVRRRADASPGRPRVSAAAGAGPAVAGVVMQMRASSQQRVGAQGR